MAADRNEDAATIQEDVERTQDAMGETVQKIEEKLNPRGVTQSLFGGENADIARDAWQVVRESPMPVALIGGGLVWLLATSRAPMISRLRDELRSRFRSAVGSTGSSGSTSELRPRSDHPAPIGPPPAAGEAFDRRAGASAI